MKKHECEGCGAPLIGMLHNCEYCKRAISKSFEHQTHLQDLYMREQMERLRMDAQQNSYGQCGNSSVMGGCGGAATLQNYTQVYGSGAGGMWETYQRNY